MVHASDHTEAPILMWRAYGKALDRKETSEQLDLLKESLPKLNQQTQRPAYVRLASSQSAPPVSPAPSAAP